MYGKSVKCDKCGHTEFVPEFGSSFDSGFEGWIRLMVNRPVQFRWVTTLKSSSVADAVDLCSLGCAYDYLAYVTECIPQPQEAQS